jgi:hypothetical protein
VFFFRVKAAKAETQLRECVFRESQQYGYSDSMLNVGVTSKVISYDLRGGCNLKIGSTGYGDRSSGIFLRLLDPGRWKH